MTYALTIPYYGTLTRGEVRSTLPSQERSPAMNDLSVARVSDSSLQAQQESAISSPWLNDLLQTLTYLANLEPGWDDGTALPIDGEIVKLAKEFVSSDLVVTLNVPPNIVPTIDGNIQIEWHTKKVDLIIELSKNANTSFYFYDNESGIETEALVGDRTQIKNLANAFVALGYEI